MSRRSRTSTRFLTATLPLALTGTLLASPAPAGAARAPDPEVARHSETGLVGYIGAPSGRPIEVSAPAGASAATVARTFLRQRATSLGLADPRTTLRVAEQHRSTAGGTTVRVAQVHDGVPVLGGEFTVNLDARGRVLSLLGEASPVATPAPKPAVGPRRAARAAVAKVARQAAVPRSRLTAATPALRFYDPRLLGAPGPFQTARLSWVTEVRSTRPALAHTVVVDAASGTVSLSFSTLAQARNRRVCDANNMTAHYPCTSPTWTETSQPGGADADVVAAFDYSGDTYDFFSSRFGRDSLDDAGMTLVSTTDYCPADPPCQYQNAFWDGAQMVYGDGFAVADDVVGHELAHGVTDFSSSLFYYMQSGAINESMSDIFGELIDLTNGSGTDTAGTRWLMGEDIPGIGAIRDMEDPPAYDQPDRMGSPFYFSGAGDGGGVHYNSGVSNKATYLLVDGGTFNGHTVGQLGLDKTALLFYTVNNDLLVSGSDFADLADALRQACTTLAGAGTGGFVTADCAKVEHAVLATEMDLDPPAAPTRVVPACPSGSPVYTYRDDLETPAGQFGVMPIAGGEVWSYPQNPNDYAGFDATYATSGETNIWGDNPDFTTDSALRMTTPVTIPANAFLYFNHAHGFESGFYDGGVVEYSAGGGPWTDAGSLFTTGDGAGGYNGTIVTGFGNPLAGRAAFGEMSNGYGSSRADLDVLAGQSVAFRWRIGTDGTVADYGWFIDDVSIHRCATDTTPPDTTITSGPADGATVTTTEVTYGFTASEVGSTFQCKLDGGTFAACTSPKTWTGLSEGAHTFSVRATDGAGNTDATPATRTFTVDLPDTTPPDTTITSGPADGATVTTTEVTYGFTASEVGSTFQCKLDGGTFAACTSPKTWTGLSEGAHTFSVRATDGAGNTDATPATRTFTVDLPDDTTPPDTTITQHPRKETFSRRATFAFTSSEAGGTFQCKLDGAAWEACTSPWEMRVSRGKHVFRVKATDGAGNTDATPAIWRWTVKRRR